MDHLDDPRDLERHHNLQSIQVGAAFVCGGIVAFGNVTSSGVIASLRFAQPNTPQLDLAHIVLQALNVPLLFAGAGFGYALAGHLLLKDTSSWGTTFTPNRLMRLVALLLIGLVAKSLESSIGPFLPEALMLAGVLLAVAFPPPRGRGLLLVGLASVLFGMLALGAIVGRAAGTQMVTTSTGPVAAGPGMGLFVVLTATAMTAAFVAPWGAAIPLLRREVLLFGALSDGDYASVQRLAHRLRRSWMGQLYTGIAARHRGEMAEARDVLEQCKHSYWPKRQAAAVYELAWVAYAEGDLTRARALFRESSELHRFWPAHDGLALCVLGENIEPQTALEHADYALDNVYRSPTMDWLGIDRFTVSLATRAWALAACGEPERARKVANDALARCTVRPGHRAQVLWRLAEAALHFDHNWARDLADEGALDSGTWGHLSRRVLDRLADGTH